MGGLGTFVYKVGLTQFFHDNERLTTAGGV
jgi:hypothetical protein